MDEIFSRLGGIRPVVGDSFLPMSEEELIAIETSLSVRLPSEYRSLLLRYGASAFNEYIDYRPLVPFPLDLYPTGMGHFSLFYGSQESASRGYGLKQRIDYFAGRVPSTLIPIADNGMGDQICLCIDGDRAGQVFLWDLQAEPLSTDDDEDLEDHEEPMPKVDGYSNIHLIADSFMDFLNRLEISDQ